MRSISRPQPAGGPAWAFTLCLALSAAADSTVASESDPPAAELLAGAAAIDVTPPKLPVLVNGGFLTRSVAKINTKLHARALALSSGATQLVIVVVDSCMLPRDLIDEAKKAAAEQTGVPANQLLISATHTHSAPSCMGALGSESDPQYVPFLRMKLVEVVVAALSKRQPAKIGFGKAAAGEFTALRRWIRRPDRVGMDPFGNPTIRANMHAANNWDDVTGESGPEDPDLALLSVQTLDGRPLAVVANFSMHYFGDRDISADYFGRFCEGLKARVAPDSEFVAIFSHGCSGDIWRRDYSKPPGQRNDARSIDDYTRGLLTVAMGAYDGIVYREQVTLKMIERRMTLNYRVPDQQWLEWAQRIVSAMGERPPKDRREVYAREQILLHERQKTEIVLQGIRIGDVGIATTPNETYALTGLKIKAASPFRHTMVIELANGGDGYIPPPEQHLLGGYNTWPARSAGLEVAAEPRIAEACIELLEEVSGRTRRQVRSTRGAAAQAITALRPALWWRLDEFSGPRALDSSNHRRDGIYEPGVVFFLDGPHPSSFCTDGETNRAAMFAGGRVQGRVESLGTRYSVSLWLWNGMPNGGRAVSGWLFSRGRDHGLGSYGEHLGVGGTSGNTGRLIFQHGANSGSIVAGKTEIPRWEWRHVVYVRDGDKVYVYLGGKLELETKSPAEFPAGFDTVFVGGRSDRQFNWEGRLDEVAMFDRALTAEEVRTLVP